MAVVAQAEVLGQREVEHEAAPVAILRDVADAGLEAVRGAWPGEMSWPRRRMVPAVGRRRPVIASTSSLWPFPSTPAMPDDLAGAHVERGAAHGLEPAVSWTTQVADLEQRLARAGAAPFSTRSSTAPADHQLGQLSLGRVLRGDRADHLARGAAP